MEEFPGRSLRSYFYLASAYLLANACKMRTPYTKTELFYRDGRSYEISEHFYLKWGWILDEYAIATTDYWRRKRGLRSIRSVGPAGSVPRAGIPGKRKLHVDDLEMWGGRDAIGHLVSSSGEVRDPHAA